jgi:hypothetical protein
MGREFVYQINIGCSCFNVLKRRPIIWVHFKNKHCLKADFQSSHEAPRSSLRVHAWALSSNHNAKQLILITCKHSQRAARSFVRGLENRLKPRKSKRKLYVNEDNLQIFYPIDLQTLIKHSFLLNFLHELILYFVSSIRKCFCFSAVENSLLACKDANQFKFW